MAGGWSLGASWAYFEGASDGAFLASSGHVHPHKNILKNPLDLRPCYAILIAMEPEVHSAPEQKSAVELSSDSEQVLGKDRSTYSGRRFDGLTINQVLAAQDLSDEWRKS